MARNVYHMSRDWKKIYLSTGAEKGFRGVMKVLRDIRNGTGSTFDLHSENLMLRGERVIVTDPLYEYGTYSDVWYKKENAFEVS